MACIVVVATARYNGFSMGCAWVALGLVSSAGPSMTKPRALHLFSGCGGISLGFESAGFETVGVVEVDRAAADTYRRNFSVGDEGFFLGPEHGDIKNVDFRSWLKGRGSAKARRIDVITGGSPCQAFSRVGRGKLNATKGNFVADRRNDLWRDFFRAVETLRPRVFLYENVPGMLHHGGRNVAEDVCRAGEDLGYFVRCAVINAAGFGVPQTRERLFVVGIEEGEGDGNGMGLLPIGGNLVEDTATLGAHVATRGLFHNADRFLGFIVPKSIGECVSVRAAIGDLPAFTLHLRRGYSSKSPPAAKGYRPGRPSMYAKTMREWIGRAAGSTVEDHYIKATPRDYGTFRSMAEGDKYPQALKVAERRYRMSCAARKRWGRPRPRRNDFVPPYRSDVFPEKWRKLVGDLPSWTITAHLAKDVYSHIHYDSSQARTITIREAARIQSFPDGFQFCGNVGDRFRQIGNAVPPLLARALAFHIRKLI